MTWNLLHIIDYLLWIFMAGSVFYVVFFAIASLLRDKKATKKSSYFSQHRFYVIIPAYHEDSVIRQTVEAFLKQDYPQSLYQLAVVSDHMTAETNEWLSEQRLWLLQPSFSKSSKAKALQFAINHAETTEKDAPFQYVVILDADNLVSPTFLTQLNEVCCHGYQAIQCHRTAKNSDNDIAILDGVSEEINNCLFRRAHNSIGLSSALIGSGMCFSYDWFNQNVSHLNTAVEDRELEAQLMKQNVFIRYEKDIYVKDEKVNDKDNFQRQRLRWMTGQIQTLLFMLPYLPKAISQWNVNYIDKTIQQMLIPRSILLISLLFFAILMTLVASPWSIKWWLLLITFSIGLIIAIPPQMRTRAIFGRVISLPILVWRMLVNLFHIDKNNKEFIHTVHHQDSTKQATSSDNE